MPQCVESAAGLGGPVARGSAVRLVAWGFGSVESWGIFLWPPSSVPEDHESSGMYFKLK